MSAETTKCKILIVDDEKPLRDTLARWFKPTYDCRTAPDAETALAALAAEPDIALLITDVRMPGEDGVSLVHKAKELHPDLACILLTAYGTLDLAVDAMREGADDFFQKPVTDLKTFELRVAKAVEKASLKREVASLKRQVAGLQAASDTELENFTGRSPAMENVYRLIRTVAPTDANVLVTGPSGTGKELTARALHRLSKRAERPFVAVECSAFSGELLKSELFGYEPGTFTGGLKEGKKGCFEAAAGGTLFLDEVGEMDMPTQTALLRTLETKCVRRLGGVEEIPVDFRLVAATNRDLSSMIANGTFREDLFYRLNVIDIRLPALKDRPGDIALLAGRYLREFAERYGRPVPGLDPAAQKALENYPWPGNVRQLRNVIEKMVVLSNSPRLGFEDLPPEIVTPTVSPVPTASIAPAQTAVQTATAAPAAGTPGSLAESERQQIIAALAACRDNRTEAARRLGISRRTLHRKIKEWNLA